MRKKRQRNIFAIILLGFAHPAWARSSNNVMRPGVWHGTVGKEQVRVCIDKTDGVGSLAYWPNRQEALTLSAFLPKQNDVTINLGWAENLEWRLRPHSLNSQQVWLGESRHQSEDPSNNNGNAVTILPIRLKWYEPLRSKTETARWGSPCGRSLFAPFIKAQSVREQPAQWQGRAYSRLVNRYGETMALPTTPQASATQEAAILINQHLRDWLRARWESEITCTAGRSGTNKLDRRGDFKVRPVAWSNRWLAVRATESNRYCGGAHGSYTSDYRVFDLKTGRIANPDNWLRGLSEFGFTVPDSRLAKAIAPYNYKSIDTDGMPTAVYANAKGIVFLFINGACHADPDLCTRRMTVPYAALKPYLTQAGQKVMVDWTAESSDNPSNQLAR